MVYCYRVSSVSPSGLTFLHPCFNYGLFTICCYQNKFFADKAIVDVIEENIRDTRISIWSERLLQIKCSRFGVPPTRKVCFLTPVGFRRTEDDGIRVRGSNLYIFCLWFSMAKSKRMKKINNAVDGGSWASVQIRFCCISATKVVWRAVDSVSLFDRSLYWWLDWTIELSFLLVLSSLI